MLGHQKGRDTKDNVARNFGMASPGGYRKAMRLMEHANRFGMPILTCLTSLSGGHPTICSKDTKSGGCTQTRKFSSETSQRNRSGLSKTE